MTAPLRLLLLEDSVADAEVVEAAVLRAYPSSTLDVVQDEAGFILALRARRFHLVLSDFEIAGYSGAEALAAAKVLAPLAPFIFVSRAIGDDNAVEMMKRGATDVVSINRLARLPVALERALREVDERSARERAERQLREVDRIYGRVVDALKDYAVILLDQDGLIRDWNRGADIVFGISREDALGTSVARLFTAQDRAAGIVEAEFDVAMRNGTHAEDRWLLRADGTTLRADGVLTALRDDDGTLTGFCKIVRDATVAFELSVALREAKDEAERANRTKDRFLAVLSHELRTPLAPIASAARLLEDQAGVPDDLAGLLPMIRRNVALEARLIEDLLDLTAIAAGKVTLKPAPVDMRAVVAGVADMVADAVAEGGLTFTLHWRTQRTWVEGDAARLHQVLWNIVRNAVKFTASGGCVELVVDDDGPWLRLRCIDDGIGVEPAAQGRIFSAFEQADHETAQRYGGLGLGLAIAHGLVMEHHGELAVESSGVGRGATFTLRLQALARTAGSDTTRHATDLAAAGAFPATQGKPLHMLLVEDNEDAAAVMTLSFEYLGYRVTHAPTLARALAAARSEVFDIILSDLGLPDGSGLELGRALDGRVPLIALSGFGSEEDLRRSAAAGFSDHLVKPADPDDIHAAIGRALAREGSALPSA